MEIILLDIGAVAHWLVLVGGIVVCLRSRYLSNQIWLIAAGLVGLLVAEVLQRFLVSALGPQGEKGVWFALAICNIFSLGAWVAIVAGLGLTFRDVTARMRQLYHQAHPPSAADAS